MSQGDDEKDDVSTSDGRPKKSKLWYGVDSKNAGQSYSKYKYLVNQCLHDVKKFDIDKFEGKLIEYKQEHGSVDHTFESFSFLFQCTKKLGNDSRIKRHRHEIIKLLLNHGADPNKAFTHAKETSLHRVCNFTDQTNVLNWFLSSKARQLYRNKDRNRNKDKTKENENKSDDEDMDYKYFFEIDKIGNINSLTNTNMSCLMRIIKRTRDMDMINILLNFDYHNQKCILTYKENQKECNVFHLLLNDKKYNENDSLIYFDKLLKYSIKYHSVYDTIECLQTKNWLKQDILSIAIDKSFWQIVELIVNFYKQCENDNIKLKSKHINNNNNNNDNSSNNRISVAMILFEKIYFIEENQLEHMVPSKVGSKVASKVPSKVPLKFGVQPPLKAQSEKMNKSNKVEGKLKHLYALYKPFIMPTLIQLMPMLPKELVNTIFEMFCFANIND